MTGGIAWSGLLRALFAALRRRPARDRALDGDRACRATSDNWLPTVIRQAEARRSGRDRIDAACRRPHRCARRAADRLGVPRLSLAGGLAQALERWLAPATRDRARRADRRCARVARRALPASGSLWRTCTSRPHGAQCRPDGGGVREAPDAVAAAGAAASRHRSPSLPRPAAPSAAGRGDLRAGQLGPRGDLRQAPDRAASRHSGRRRRAEHRDRLPAAPALKGQLFLAVSQSGRSDDLVEQAREARGGRRDHRRPGERRREPAGAACDIVLPMTAGAGAQRRGDQDVRRVAGSAACASSPLDRGRRAAAAAWSDLPRAARAAHATRLERRARRRWPAPTSLVTIGRGPTLAIAREAALKLKETCEPARRGLQRRGVPARPGRARVAAGYPILMFVPATRRAAGCGELAADLRGKGAARSSGGAGRAGRAGCRRSRRTIPRPTRSV